MTYDYGTGHPVPETQASTPQVALEQAAGVAGTAKEAGMGLVGEAGQQARDVTAEAGRQAQHMLRQAGTELSHQAATQQQRLAGGLRTLGGELHSMAEGAGSGAGIAADVARQIAGRTDSVATWLDQRDPGAVVDDVKDFARRRPGVFLAVAAGLGLLAGRLTRGVKDAAGDERSGTAGTRAPAAHRAPGAPLTAPMPSSTPVPSYAEPAFASPGSSTGYQGAGAPLAGTAAATPFGSMSTGTSAVDPARGDDGEPRR